MMDLAGHKFDERILVERVMRNMRPPTRYGMERWVLVKSLFGVGSTVAHLLCHEFGMDPDEILKR